MSRPEEVIVTIAAALFVGMLAARGLVIVAVFGPGIIANAVCHVFDNCPEFAASSDESVPHFMDSWPALERGERPDVP